MRCRSHEARSAVLTSPSTLRTDALPPSPGRLDGPASLHARHVLAGARVDLDLLALADEQRHAHDRAGLERGWLAAATRGVAAHARIGLGDLELDEHRRR